MIIRISARAEGDGGAPEELLILELQGNVLPTKPASLADSERTAASGRTAAAGVVDPTASLDGLLIGHLSMRPDGKGQLQVGNHRITGSIEALPKPLVLIDRAPPGDAGGGAPLTAPGDEELLGPAYHVVGVIRKRLRFEDRPQTIVRAAQ